MRFSWLLSKRVARVAALAGLSIVLMFTSAGARSRAAADDPTSATFVLTETNCGAVYSYTFTIDGTSVATINPAYSCSCNGSQLSVTVTDPAVLSRISQPVCQEFGLSINSSYSYVGWARVDINRRTVGRFADTDDLVAIAPIAGIRLRGVDVGLQMLIIVGVKTMG